MADMYMYCIYIEIDRYRYRYVFKKTDNVPSQLLPIRQ